MKIRVKNIYSIMLFLSGMLYALFIGSIAINSGKFFVLDILIAIVLIIAGILSRRSDYFELDDHSLIMRNLFGGIYKKYDFSSKSDFKISGKNVILAQEGKKGETFYPYIANPADWAAFLEWINQ